MTHPVIVKNIPSGINNTVVVEKTRSYGVIVEWELHHSCFDGRVSHKAIINKQQCDINQKIFCPYCQSKIIQYDNIVFALKEEAGIFNDC